MVALSWQPATGAVGLIARTLDSCLAKLGQRVPPRMNCPANRLALIIRAEHGSTDHRRRSLYSTNWQHSCLQSESLVPFYGDVAEPLISSRRRRARSQVSFAGCEGSSVDRKSTRLNSSH